MLKGVGVKKLILFFSMAVVIAACLPAPAQQDTNPSPIPDEILQVTAAVLAEQTLQAAAPTETTLPSETPVIVTPSLTATLPTPTETVNPVLLTLTATLLAGTPTNDPAVAIAESTTSSTPSATTIASTGPITGSPEPLFYGTLPPNLPYGTVNLFNRAHVEVYISLRCVTKDGYVTIIEYPVKKTVTASAPAGKYTYVAWVGGQKFQGSFSLDKDGFVTITFFNDKVNVKTKQ